MIVTATVLHTDHSYTLIATRHSPSPGAGNATWRGDFRGFNPNNQDESVAARVDEPDPLDEPLSPLSNE